MSDTKTVTLGTNRVSFRAQQLGALAAMWVVAGRASLLEHGLMQDALILQFGLVGVAIQADIDGVLLGISAVLAGVRVMTIGAIALRTLMLELCGFNSGHLIGMTTRTQRLDALLRESHPSIAGRRVTDIAELLAKGGMQVSLHELGPIGLVRIVTAHAIGLRERLALVRLDQRGVRGIMAIQAKRGRSFREVEGKLRIRAISTLVNAVASVAAEVKGLVPAAAFRNVHAGLVATKAEIFLRARA